MDSLNQSNKKLPSLRTYAKDLEFTRKEKNIPAETDIPKPTKASVPTAPPRKKEPLITATPVPKPKPEIISHAETYKSTPALKPIPAKMPLPKLPTITAEKSPTFIVENEDAAAATIITDTKHNRFKLFPSLFSSIKEWFDDKKNARAAKNAPKYTVPETTRRKGVIQKATSTTGKSATADFASIQERIKQRKAHVEKAEPHTTWSANTEPVFLLLEGEVAQKVTNVQLVNRKSFRTPPTPIPAPVPPPPPAPVPPTLDIISAPIAPIAPVIVTPTPQETTIPIISATVDTPVAATAVTEVPEPTEVETPVSTESEPPVEEELIEVQNSSTKHTFLSLNTNLLALSVSGVTLAIVIMVTFGYIVFFKESSVSNTTAIPPSAILQTSSFSNITDTPLLRTALITKLSNLATESTEMIGEFAFSSTTKVAYTPQEIIATLKIPVEQNFAQGLKTIHFGYVRNTEPYVLIEVTDKITALGGLLAWEQSMYTDFNTLYSRKTDVLGSRLKFIDGTFRGGDVRSLRDDTGREIVIYGMLDTTVLITTTSETFSEIANLIQ